MLRPGDRPVVMISAGVGATPVLAMLHALAEQPSRREVWWLHAARNGAEHAFDGEVRGLLTELPHAHRVVCYSQPRPCDRHFDVAGRLTTAVLNRSGVPSDADAYVCGPDQFMHDIGAALTARGTAPERVSTEVFGPADASTPGVVGGPERSPHPPAGPHAEGPLISFSRSNLSVPWDSAFASLLDFAEACDVPVRWSCRTGVCHTCETGLVSGNVTYGPEPLEPPPPGSALICCSRPGGEVTLEL